MQGRKKSDAFAHKRYMSQETEQLHKLNIINVKYINFYTVVAYYDTFKTTAVLP